MGVPRFPPVFEEWLPATPPAPPIPRWLYENIRDAIPFVAELERGFAGGSVRLKVA